MATDKAEAFTAGEMQDVVRALARLYNTELVKSRRRVKTGSSRPSEMAMEMAGIKELHDKAVRIAKAAEDQVRAQQDSLVSSLERRGAIRP